MIIRNRCHDFSNLYFLIEFHELAIELQLGIIISNYLLGCEVTLICTNSDSICLKKQAYLNIFDTSYVFTTYALKIVTPQQS